MVDAQPSDAEHPTGVGIRAAAPDDDAAVDEVHRAAFGTHGTEVVRLLRDLRRRDRGDDVSLVAFRGDSVIGHVQLSGCLIDAARRLVPALVLSPISVAPEHQRAGVGSLLVDAAIRAARAKDAPVLLLEGDPRFYRRFGFRPGGELGLRRPSLRIPEEAFQALGLTTFEPWMTGTMVYPDVWWEHDAVGLREE